VNTGFPTHCDAKIECERSRKVRNPGYLKALWRSPYKTNPCGRWLLKTDRSSALKRDKGSQLLALQTLMIANRFRKLVYPVAIATIGIRRFVDNNYQHPLTFDILYLLRNFPTSIWRCQTAAPGADDPLITPLSKSSQAIYC